eukprot:6188371-Pleurochrysis_carterae.AAC.1
MGPEARAATAAARACASRARVALACGVAVADNCMPRCIHILLRVIVASDELLWLATCALTLKDTLKSFANSSRADES